MKRITYWWPLAKNLAAFLNAQTDDTGEPLFGTAQIYTGARGTSKSYPCIEVTYDGEADVPLSMASQGRVILWIDVWVKSGSKDPEDAYALQDVFQQRIFSALTDWPSYILATLQVATKLNLKDVASDGDMYRPACGARIVLEIEWRKSV